MNEKVKNRYKPYRFSINQGTTIIDSSSGKFIIKQKTQDLATLFNYLDSKGFYNHPVIDFDYKNESYVTKFVEEDFIIKEQKEIEFAKIVASLHNKTVFFKETSTDNYKEIYEIVQENINYMQVFYEGLFLNNLKKEFQSPSEYLFNRNYYKIKSALAFAKDKLDSWYENVNKENMRVSIIHNNLSLNHFIYNVNESIITSWDKYRIDSPIIDIINYYKTDFDSSNFKSFLKEYFRCFDLLESEKDLLFIILALPIPLKIDNTSEFEKTRIVKNVINYIYKTESIIRPYYSENKEKQE
ncbi:MAG: hypothetical protein IKR74_02005 [Bacilli bacterium]|nr:hypothetical protein [Bacilli bacterium]